MSDAAAEVGAPSGRMLITLSLPALLLGVLSSLVLWLLDQAAHLLEGALWEEIPHALGIDPGGWGWILGILTLTGLAVGVVIWLAPGHGGHDSATVELVAPVLPLRALPGVAAAVLLGLAGGVSLGPESPIIAINTAIAVALVARLAPRVPHDLVLMITAAATIGAMFGTPVAAALIFTGLVAGIRGGAHLWDKLFLPLVAAGAGAVTTGFLGGPTMALALPEYAGPVPIDFLTGTIIAAAATGLGVVATVVFPHLHRAFRRLRHPVLALGLGGLILGLLGILGGPVTLFKGLTQMQDLLTADLAVGSLVIVVLVKLAALLISATAGFRGGRIFPAVFIGVAVGLLASSLVPSIPLPLAVACGVLGIVLVVGRDGWLALFLAVAIGGDVRLLPLLCIVVLPVWLIVRAVPEMIVHPSANAPGEPARF
jgi:H+/Cl- antiporter ClcA